MILRDNERIRETRVRMRGGEGETRVAYLPPAALASHVRLLGEIVIPAGASIGNHVHEGETEWFLILSGRGGVNDDGRPEEVGPGDVVVTGGGAAHGIQSLGPGDLRMVAVIATDA
ncbi:MAG: cupin domain-containing protein [Spirochaetaceae bacterium]|nr:cupin domain-containing protein [Spirochaetaceae bacterium]